MVENNQLRIVHITMDEMANTIREIVASELQKINSNMTVVRDEVSDELMSRTEVSQLLKVSFTTLYWWDKKGILKSEKLGRRVYYSRSNVMGKVINLKNAA